MSVNSYTPICAKTLHLANQVKFRSVLQKIAVWQMSYNKKGKGVLFNVGSRRKPESLFPADPTAGVLNLQHPV